MKKLIAFSITFLVGLPTWAQGDIFLTADSTDHYIIDGMQPHDNGGFIYSCRKCSNGCMNNEDDTIKIYRKYATGAPVEICKREYSWWFPVDWDAQHIARWNSEFLYACNSDLNDLLIYKLDSSGNIYDSLVFADSVLKAPTIIVGTSDGGAIIGGYESVNLQRSWVLKLDSNLNLEWTKYFVSSNNIWSAWARSSFLEETPDSGFVWAWSSDTLIKINSSGTVIWSKPMLPAIGILDIEIDLAGSIDLLVYSDTALSSFPAPSWMGILRLDPSGIASDSIIVNPTGYMDVYSYKLFVVPNGNMMVIEGDYDNLSVNVQVLDSNGMLLDFNRNYVSFWPSFWGWPESTADGGKAIHGNAYNYSTSSYQGLIIVVDSVGKIFPNLIAGKLHDDPDGDCVYDSGENNLQGWFVEISNPNRNYIATSDTAGNYKISVPAGTYSVVQVQHANRNAICPVSPPAHFLSFGPGSNVANNIDFSNQLIPGMQDVAVSITNVTPIRLSQQSTFEITLRNNGSIPMSGVVSLTYASPLSFDSSSNIPASAVANVLTWNYSNLQYDEVRNIFVYLTVPLSYSIGDTLPFTLSISPMSGDVNPSDNTVNWDGIIIGSYDPNEKKVSPEGWGTEGFIFAGTPLTYTIFFQNTGNDTAFNIRITDILDSALDWSTFHLESSSHPCSYELSTGGLVEFRFNNIMLPDSFVNEPQSHGFVKFSIGQNPMLPPYTEITNTANIYFDVNAAVITNTTTNTIADPNSILNPIANFEVNITPNPVSDYFQIELPTDVCSTSTYIELYDVSGRLAMREMLDSNRQTISRGDLDAGSYVCLIVVDGVTVDVGKIILE